MKRLRLMAAGTLLAMALAGCSTIDALTTSSQAQATTALAAEATYSTVITPLEVDFANSGKETKAQAQFIKAVDTTLYDAVVAARVATANGDSAALAAALSIFNADWPKLQTYIGGAQKGGGS